MKLTPASDDADRILDEARSVWRAARDRDEESARAASERRIVERRPPEASARSRAIEGGPRSFALAFGFALAAAAVIVLFFGSRSRRAIPQPPNEPLIQADRLPSPVAAPKIPAPRVEEPASVPALATQPEPSAKAVAVSSVASRVDERPRPPLPELPPLPPPAPSAPKRPFVVAPPVPAAPPPRPSVWKDRGADRPGHDERSERGVPSGADPIGHEALALALVELEKGNVPGGRERLRKLTTHASPQIAYEAAVLLARSYSEPTEQLAVWEAVIPHLSEAFRGRADRERVRVLIRLGRKPPTPTTAE